MKLKNRERGAMPQADRKKSNVLLVEFLPKVNRNGVADVWCWRQHRHWTPFPSDKSVVNLTSRWNREPVRIVTVSVEPRIVLLPRGLGVSQ